MRAATACRWTALVLAVVAAGWFVATRVNLNPAHRVGDRIDEFNGVAVYYNGAVDNTSGRNTAADGYNIGLKFQCVEFVKRYYAERLGHRMPDTLGHARDYFAAAVPDGGLNKSRGLLQFRNGGGAMPATDDLIVFKPWLLNRFGHVAIVSAVGADFIEVVQQNPGPFGSTRERYPLTPQREGAPARVDHSRVLGWLRVPPAASAAAP